MIIDKYKNWGDQGYTLDGCYYDDEVSLVGTGMLGFCGCGDPDSAIAYIRDALNLIDTKLNWDAPKKQFDMEYKNKCDKEDALFGTNGARYFVWYWLDKEGYTEHGGSVPGWLTDKGIELLNILNEITFEDSDEQR